MATPTVRYRFRNIMRHRLQHGLSSIDHAAGGIAMPLDVPETRTSGCYAMPCT
ncbi:hypothetical protein BIFGAL_03756 [Bifidobacterium gallicum DSM 20093 = LMG 11596]|uniref:Uncharacterized protein n=1 Tax=Bifidobacterium gallicum DSM 20093 = LMG 11596 TaxID=561180 RepID=D1NV73_9BIFI|nr:hypothetical protein BIFGAL_03756 [Bifidobacterium gallicum DSM 20093 = LMG 11596]